MCTARTHKRKKQRKTQTGSPAARYSGKGVTKEAMASRRSPAASHSINQRRVPMGHVSVRNPLQAPKERSCGTSITSPSLGSAKRDRLSSSTSYGMCQSPFGELYLGGGIARTPQLRCFAACSGFHDIGPAPRNLQLMLHLLASSHSRPPISILLINCPWVRGYGETP